MEHTWRWFGPADPITLADVRQTGATGVVTALHEIPNGEVWPVEAIAARRREVEAAGLTWSVVESIPVHEDVKQGGPRAAEATAAWAQTVRNLAECGLDVVCWNFMPVLDWTRTDLAHRMPDGGWALRFDEDAYAAFDLFVLRRPGAEAERTPEEVARARAHLDGLDAEGVRRLERTVLAGLPGSEEHWDLDGFRAALGAYDGIGPDELRGHLRTFLEAVVPVAQTVGVRLAVHPDDPPRPLFGLPRVVSTVDDAAWLLDAVPLPANGLTLCVGSYGSRPDNDVPAMARRFARRIWFAHLRDVTIEADGRSFHEAVHVGGGSDMVAVVSALVAEERRRAAEGGPRLPMRPDHGHRLLDDQRRTTNPGYSLIGRLKGLAELRGLELAVQHLLP
ncbi:mannonate dehydratase [Cellulomonas endophytica]|uniref:mannonate dehydratase n=1 Tax=Cellulomonas endophytica TaxID=2494735 RepID=UPI00101252A7|nr:mannonate dehydratase [Cellulomonas endophytica]